MPSERSSYGLLVSALGAALLAVSVFLPWYALNVTSVGAGSLPDVARSLVAQFGHAVLPPANLHGSVASLSGHQLAAVSAQQVLHGLNVVLLVLAGAALVDVLLPLLRGGGSLRRGAVARAALPGAAAVICVLYRMAYPPVPVGGLVTLSLREGCWLALLGSLMMVLGPMWPRLTFAPASAESIFTGA